MPVRDPPPATNISMDRAKAALRVWSPLNLGTHEVLQFLRLPRIPLLSRLISTHYRSKDHADQPQPQ
jgi:hypothetical protein